MMMCGGWACTPGIGKVCQSYVVESKLKQAAVINLTKATKKKRFSLLHETKSDMVLITVHMSRVAIAFAELPLKYLYSKHYK